MKTNIENTKKLIRQFEELLQVAKDNIDALRDIALQLNNQEQIFLLIDGSEQSVSNASIDDLQDFISKIKIQLQANINAEKQSVYRDVQIARNRYSKDKPYPQD